ncbi:hypothetical protein XpopCFBP1817_03685, partial [Xanthomonas populi]
HARTCFYTIRVQPADLSRENVGKPQVLEAILQTAEIFFSSIGQATIRNAWRYFGLSLLAVAVACGFIFLKIG